MREDRKSIKEFLKEFDEGKFDSKSVDVQCDAGWWDWFCKDHLLRDKTYKLVKKLKTIVNSPKIDQDTMYVWFKNNCPMNGALYDDFRIAELNTGDIVFTVTPKLGYRNCDLYGKSEVYGRENGFKEALVLGTWDDVVTWFYSK